MSHAATPVQANLGDAVGGAMSPKRMREAQDAAREGLEEAGEGGCTGQEEAEEAEEAAPQGKVRRCTGLGGWVRL